MPKPKKSKTRSTPKAAEGRPVEEKLIEGLFEALRREERDRLGTDSTFEERQDAGFEIMREVLRRKTDIDLREQVTDVEAVDVGGKSFRRLEQASSATYFSRFGAHHIEEPLYREVGVHNGPTLKPIELRAGIIAHMTPDMARVVGELSAEKGSRGLVRTLKAVGHLSPSRAFVADRVTEMSVDIADIAGELEAATRMPSELPQGVAWVSCGLDRMSVRMAEAVEGSVCSRAEPYQRSPPPMKDY